MDVVGFFFLCVHVGACLRQLGRPSAILLLAQNPLVPSFAHSIVSCSLSHFTLLPWCGVSLISLQDYIVKILLLLHLLLQTRTHTQAYIVLPASAKSQQFSAEPLLFLGGTLIPGAALCGHLMAGIEQ